LSVAGPVVILNRAVHLNAQDQSGDETVFPFPLLEFPPPCRSAIVSGGLLGWPALTGLVIGRESCVSVNRV